jgi:hypothetical protein
MEQDPLVRLKGWVDGHASQSEAAKVIGIPQATLSRILTKTRSVGMEVGVLIENAVGIPVRAWSEWEKRHREGSTIAAPPRPREVSR